MKVSKTFERNAPLAEKETLDAFREWLPIDYIYFLYESDGGEGFISGDAYVMLWRASELAEFNRDYEVSEYAPGLFLFGSNGGGEAYAFDLRENLSVVVQVPFIGMDLSAVLNIAKTFNEFMAGEWVA